MPNPFSSDVSRRELATVISSKMEVWRSIRKLKPERTRRDFIELLVDRYKSSRSRRYGGLAADFDGTLAWIANRDDGPSPAIVSALAKLLKKRCPLVILTGRGRSIQPFFKPLAEKSSSMCFCLYNGAKIVRAGAEAVLFERLLKKSGEIYEVLCSDPVLSSCSRRIDIKKYGIQVFPKEDSVPLAFSRVQGLIKQYGFNNVADVGSSGWTVDVTPRGIDKAHALDIAISAMDKNLGSNNILKVGDQGHRGGNDFQLLKRRNSFSVGTISGDRNSCFPVVDSAGHRLYGPRGTAVLLARTIFETP